MANPCAYGQIKTKHPPKGSGEAVAMRTIAVVNQKGGSAKTTSSVNLAAALAETGKRVLLLDLDPQANASSWLGVRDEGRGLFDVFTEGKPLLPLVTKSTAEGVDLVPSSTWLVGVERALASEVGAETVLRSAIAKLPARWDFLLVDGPPSLGFLAVAALVACSEVLVPVEPSTMALEGLVSLLGTIDRVRDRLNPDLRVVGILPVRLDRTKLASEVVSGLRSKFGKEVFETAIRENVRLREAHSHKRPITTYAGTSHGAEDYRAAAEELVRRGKKRGR